MSEVLLITVKDNSLNAEISHYRDILNKINNGIFEDGKDMDSGYILIDCDNGSIINCQNAFSKDDVTSKLLKAFTWINL